MRSWILAALPALTGCGTVTTLIDVRNATMVSVVDERGHTLIDASPVTEETCTEHRPAYICREPSGGLSAHYDDGTRDRVEEPLTSDGHLAVRTVGSRKLAWSSGTLVVPYTHSMSRGKHTLTGFTGALVVPRSEIIQARQRVEHGHNPVPFILGLLVSIATGSLLVHGIQQRDPVLIPLSAGYLGLGSTVMFTGAYDAFAPNTVTKLP